jgi:hypothetical protein
MSIRTSQRNTSESRKTLQLLASFLNKSKSGKGRDRIKMKGTRGCGKE